MTFSINNNLTYLQKNALNEVLETMQTIRETIDVDGEECNLADIIDGLVSDVEKLYLTFSKERKTYF
jgi:hypothetical protein